MSPGSEDEATEMGTGAPCPAVREMGKAGFSISSGWERGSGRSCGVCTGRCRHSSVPAPSSCVPSHGTWAAWEQGDGVDVGITFIWLFRGEKMILIKQSGFLTLPKLDKCEVGESSVSPQTPLHLLVTTLLPSAFANSKYPIFSPK